MTKTNSLLILGGSSLITHYLLPRLQKDARSAVVVARQPIVLPAGCDFVSFADLRSGRWRAPDGCCIASLLPLPALIPLLALFVRAREIVALGSTSVFSKAASGDPSEREMALVLRQAEAALSDWSHAHGVPSTLLRPTLVYDGLGDKNIARMARFIRKWRVLPLARPARGLRQPIHADDVAVAMLSALGGGGEPHRVFNIAGGEQLTYRTMAERVFRSLELPPRLLMMPAGLLRFAFSVGSRVGLMHETAFGGSVFQRMNDDLIYDIAPGLEAIGYQPRPFNPSPDRG